MNQNKKNNGWILCPSKTYPGKFYYFNVLNGEAAWSLDADNNNVKSINIHKVSDKSHSYPEPTGPPKDEGPSIPHATRQIFNKANTNKIPEIGMLRRRVFNNTFNRNNESTPIFGQQAKFVQNSEMYVPNILWTAIQLPPPMSLQNSDANRYIGEDNTNFNYGRIVHSCTSSLSRRFTNYNRNVQKTDERIISESIPFHMSTPIGNCFSNSYYKTFSFGIDDERSTKIVTTLDREQTSFKRACTKPEIDENWCREQRSFDTFSPIENNEDQLNLFCRKNSETFEQVTDDSQKLGDDDLRLVLLAKRRRSVGLGELRNSEGKKIKTYKTDQNESKSTSKKRVTFSLHDDNGSDDTNGENFKTSPNNGPSTSYVSLDLSNDLWYVMVDPDTLIDEYELIEQYVQSDDKCRLLLPRSLQSEVEAMCLGDCLGRQRVIVARQSARKLAVPPPYIVPLPEIDIQNDTRDVSDVLKICSQVQRNKYELVFITNSTELFDEAESLEINCLKTDDLKATKETTPEITFALKKVKTSPDNAKSCLLSDSVPYALTNNSETPLNTLQKFSVRNAENDFIAIKKVDANTSPIDSDRLIDITRKKTPEIIQNKDNKLLNYEKAADEIGVNLKAMYLKTKIEQSKDKINEANKLKFQIHNTKMPTLSVDTKKFGRENDGNSGLSKENKFKFQIHNTKMPTLNVDTKKFGSEKDGNSGDPKKFGSEKDGHSGISNENKSKFQIKNTKMADMPTLSVDTKKFGSEKDGDSGLLKDFSIKSDLMTNNIRERMSEWICSFTQILEDALTQLMLRHIVITDNIFPPWVLYDVVESVKKMYGSRAKVGSLAEKFNSMLLANSSKIGTLKSSMTPIEFMKLFECGTVLIQTLKVELPSYEELEEAYNTLNCLLKEMQNPSDDVTVLSFHTPVVSRAEVVEETMMRRNFIRGRSDVIDYLKKHFDAWKNYVPEESQANFDSQTSAEQNMNNNVTIVRTLGRNLKLLNIDCDKTISFNKPTENTIKFSTGNIVPNKKTEDDQINATMKDLDISVINGNIIKNVDRINEFADNFKSKCDNNDISNDKDFCMERIEHNKNAKTVEEPNSTNKIANDKKDATESNMCNHDSTVDSGNVKGPTVVRKLHKIQAYEDKLRKSIDNIDLDALDYSEMNDTCSFRTYVIEESQNNDSNETSFEDAVSFVYEIKRKISKSSDNIANGNYDSIQANIVNTTTVDSVHNPNISSNDIYDIIDVDILDSICHDKNDSGFEDDSRHVHSFLQMFLGELCQILKSVHDFIVISIREFHRVDIDEQWRDNLHIKVGKLHSIISKIIMKLNGIISRESKEYTILKDMLLKAGEEASNDKRMMKYRQVVTKCLEQTLILDNALKIMGTITDHDCRGSVSTCTLDPNIRYLNIYE
ncbi:hypothetical protein evm_000903 [Chilo suppressalis]|nr:hypothetical protein evm_000903 [Chilo suppressalis]